MKLEDKVGDETYNEKLFHSIHKKATAVLPDRNVSNEFDDPKWSEFPEYQQNQRDDNDENVLNDSTLQETTHNDRLTEENIWEIISAFFEQHGLVSQQIDSYNHFVRNGIPQILKDCKPIELEITNDNTLGMDELLIEDSLNGSNEVLERINRPAQGCREWLTIELMDATRAMPQEEAHIPLCGKDAYLLYPHSCRLRKMTYSAALFCEVRVRRYKEIPSEEHTADDTKIGPHSHEGKVKLVSDHIHSKVDIGRIPVMLKSEWCNLSQVTEAEMPYTNECMHDQGGYFVVKGNEKVLISQERQAANTVMVHYKKEDTHPFVAEVRSSSDDSYRYPSAFKLKWHSGDSTIKVSHRSLTEEIPLFHFLHALGCSTDKEMLEICAYDLNDNEMLEKLRPSIQEAADINCHTSTQAVCRLSLRVRADLASRSAEVQEAVGKQFLQLTLLPHIGVDEGSEIRKAFYIGYMTNKLLQVILGRREPTDRDFYSNKRIDTAGALMGQLFHQIIVHSMHRSLKPYLEREIKKRSRINIRDAFSRYVASAVTSNMAYCLATGNWGIRAYVMSGAADGNITKTGVSQVLNRLTYSSSLSHLRRLNTPVDSTSKQTGPRSLHSSQWGVLCPSETPEGAQCGLVKNLSLMSLCSNGEDPRPVIQWLEQGGVETFSDFSGKTQYVTNGTKIFVNGRWVGSHQDALPLVRSLRNSRRRAVATKANKSFSMADSENGISLSTSIVYDARDDEVQIWTDAGRSMRPLLVVENHAANLTRKIFAHMKAEAFCSDKLSLWSKLVRSGPYIELVDTREEDSALIALSADDLQRNSFTHCEIHLSMIFGICASIIPFADHNPGTRNIYQSAMGKQAMGIYASNYAQRFDTTAHVLNYPQKPICRTMPMSYMHSNDLPAGHNAIVAIMCYSGYNQEDSIIFNQSAIDRGFFRSMRYQVYENEPKAEENCEKPDRASCKLPPNVNYDLLDSADGLATVGSRVRGGEAIFGKTEAVASNEVDRYTKRDISYLTKVTESGVVDSVLVTQTPADNDGQHALLKVKTRSCRIPIVGDKFCSRHGQKGTMGISYRVEDMPFAVDGTAPDILMNPHAIPSRMTVAHLIETLAGKVGALEGMEVDSTVFIPTSVYDISQRLHELGFQKWGKERLYCGHTGKPIDTLVFVGPTYYQRLKHLVADKIHARARGKLSTLTRQPPEGRAALGGLRFGEMERDCMISHGATAWMKERLFYVSDYYSVLVCNLCGMMASESVRHDFESRAPVYTCRACGSTNSMSKVSIPYACKLLFQELMAMSIWPRLRTRAA